jgi:hypothetical protein
MEETTMLKGATTMEMDAHKVVVLGKDQELETGTTTTTMVDQAQTMTEVTEEEIIMGITIWATTIEGMEEEEKGEMKIIVTPKNIMQYLMQNQKVALLK